MPPADLGPAALEHWHDLAPDLARLGLLHGEGAGLLAEHCQITVQWRDILTRMRREGEGIESPRRMRALRELLRCERRLLRLEDRLGMSPLARACMGLQ
ncbi:MAG: P27 family phage terminase small subunit [Planctomycetia bacterium]